MKKTARTLFLATALTMATSGIAMATPSTQIWIPSTDVQGFGTYHLGIDNYLRASGVPKSAPNGSAARDANIFDIGPVVGVLPFEKLQAEVGFDYLVNANEPNDNHPLSANFKIATPEDSLFKQSPAIAVGMYNIGPSLSSAVAPGVTSGQNIVYGLVAKTIPVAGRLSAGYYRGSKKALVSDYTTLKADNDGVLLSWDRTMSEISDKLWLAVDYMGGDNTNGSVNFGASWAFAKNVSVIFGYDVYTKKSIAGNNTFTTQLDINF
jgi:hypothetical protein